jgi:hypothetical protein
MRQLETFSPSLRKRKCSHDKDFVWFYRCGDEMMDGRRRMNNKTSPSADIVFIVEGKECNRGLRPRRKIDLLGKHLEEELRKNGMSENRFGDRIYIHSKQSLSLLVIYRYAGVVMGGDGVYSEPRVVLVQGEIWTGAGGLGKQVHGIPTGLSFLTQRRE